MWCCPPSYGHRTPVFAFWLVLDRLPVPVYCKPLYVCCYTRPGELSNLNKFVCACTAHSLSLSSLVWWQGETSAWSISRCCHIYISIFLNSWWATSAWLRVVCLPLSQVSFVGFPFGVQAAKALSMDGCVRAPINAWLVRVLGYKMTIPMSV
jgi:hypothetical protein